MNATILVGILSFAGTCVGSIGGIIASNKLVNYRLQKLEDKMDKYNSVKDRMFEAEKQLALHKEQIDEIKRNYALIKDECKIN